MAATSRDTSAYRSHPLYGFDSDAVPRDLGIDVHGGLSYSEICQEGPAPDPRFVPRSNLASHARRVCHSPHDEYRMVPPKHATDYRVRHDDAWWFGFDCNHVYDLVPDHRGDRRRFLKAETGAVYRDDAYVSAEILHLAAQLRAIAAGLPLPKREGEGPPPRGLDPEDD